MPVDDVNQTSALGDRDAFCRAVLEHAPDAIVVLSERRKIVFANERVERIFGYNREEIIGRGIEVLIPPVPGQKWKDIWLPMGPHPQMRGLVQVRPVRKDGQSFPAELSFSIIKVGHETYTTATIRDISDEKMRERALREISGTLLHAQEDERRRLSRDLHDSVGQDLALLKMNLDLLRFGRYALSEEVSAKIEQSASAAEEVVKQVRTVSYLLYPPMLEELGLASAIPTYVQGFEARSGIRTTYTISPDLGRLSREIEVTIFRVLQESLTNLHRHSGSHSAEVELWRNQDTVDLTIRDAGKGLPAEKLEEFRRDGAGTLGVGLRGMKERVQQFGGRLELTSDQQGTVVNAIIPVGNASAKPAMASISGEASFRAPAGETRSDDGDGKRVDGAKGQSKPSTTLTGNVEKIIRPVDPSEPERAQIAIEEADHLYRELRVENSLTDGNGNRVKLKPGAEVDVIVEAEHAETVPQNANEDQ